MTASCVVLDPSSAKVLLAVHNVTRLFQFPGGHLESGESSGEAAIRETLEETGVHATVWTGGRLDIPGGIWLPPPILTVEYPAPANPRWNEPAHVHVDLLHLATADSRAPTTAQADEIDAVRWLPLDELNHPDVRADVPVIAPHAWQILQHGHA